ncbi:MAG: hypothetical protein RBU37_15390 [Myxococcota bacterium]|jgi:hypothetical protein|nr:hypothetical protein [Myxococcota bacterium]
MSTFTYIVIGVAVIVLIAMFFLRPPKHEAALKKAIATHNIDALYGLLLEVQGGARQNAFEIAMRKMWDAYERELAIDLLKKMVPHLNDAPVMHTWLRNVIEIEPELARKKFDKAWLKATFKAHLAAKPPAPSAKRPGPLGV